MELSRSLFFFALVAVLSAVVSSRSNPLIRERIIGGSGAPTYQFTYQVSIRTEKEHICSGAILTDRLVITACSCVKDFDDKDINISYGSRFLNDGENTKVAQIIRHHKFDHTNLVNNIAMLFTSSKMVFVKFMVEPIALPDQEPARDEVALISGWGGNVSIIVCR